ncbi:uncharacterized protein LOC144136180 [Amblyomma americanum]
MTRPRHSLGYSLALVFSTFFSGPVSEVSGHAPPELCDSTYQPMYCRCNVDEGEEPTDVQCFVTAPFTADDAFVKIFEAKASVESLSFTTYASGTHKMDFVPTSTLSTMPNLEKLKFYQVNLGTLAKRTFYNLSKLAVLSLDSNEITFLEKESISQLPLLRKLELADNKLTSLAHGVLTELPSLTHLYLEKNQIASLADMAFSHLRNLRELDVSDNVIETLTEATFKGLDQLTRLDLFRNKLRRLGARVFSGTPMLEELDLKYNTIVEVDPLAFAGLPRLGILYLSYNRLRVLPTKMFLGTPNLMTVDLSQNKLVTLTWRTLQDLATIDASSFDLSLTGNQFVCDCRLAWMLHMENVTRSDKFRRELRHIKCDVAAAHEAATGSSKVARLRLKQLGCGEDYVHHTSLAPSSTGQDDRASVEMFSPLPTQFSPASNFTLGEAEAGGEEAHGDRRANDSVLLRALDKPPRRKKPQSAGSLNNDTASTAPRPLAAATWIALVMYYR